jgi:hypothetical protein
VVWNFTTAQRCTQVSYRASFSLTCVKEKWKYKEKTTNGQTERRKDRVRYREHSCLQCSLFRDIDCKLFRWPDLSTLILSVNCSVTWSRHTDFELRLIWRYRAHDGCDWSTGGAHPLLVTWSHLWCIWGPVFTPLSDLYFLRKLWDDCSLFMPSLVGTEFTCYKFPTNHFSIYRLFYQLFWAVYKYNIV